MRDKMSNKDIEQKYKNCLKNIKLHFKLLSCLHELALANSHGTGSVVPNKLNLCLWWELIETKN